MPPNATAAVDPSILRASHWESLSRTDPPGCLQPGGAGRTDSERSAWAQVQPQVQAQAQVPPGGLQTLQPSVGAVLADGREGHQQAQAQASCGGPILQVPSGSLVMAWSHLDSPAETMEAPHEAMQAALATAEVAAARAEGAGGTQDDKGCGVRGGGREEGSEDASGKGGGGSSNDNAAVVDDVELLEGLQVAPTGKIIGRPGPMRRRGLVTKPCSDARVSGSANTCFDG